MVRTYWNIGIVNFLIGIISGWNNTKNLAKQKTWIWVVWMLFILRFLIEFSPWFCSLYFFSSHCPQNLSISWIILLFVYTVILLLHWFIFYYFSITSLFIILLFRQSLVFSSFLCPDKVDRPKNGFENKIG